MRRALLCAVALCSSLFAVAADDEAPDSDFLEYLGMWEESDEDWVIIDGVTAAATEERSDPVPEGEELQEIDDES
jgi:hypothetical protein